VAIGQSARQHLPGQLVDPVGKGTRCAVGPTTEGHGWSSVPKKHTCNGVAEERKHGLLLRFWGEPWLLLMGFHCGGNLIAHSDMTRIVQVVGGCRRTSQNTNRKMVNSFTVSDGGCQEAIGLFRSQLWIYS